MATTQPSLRESQLIERKAAPLQYAVLGWTDFIPLRVLGQKGFLQLRDLTFALEDTSSAVRPIQNKFYASLAIFPISIFLNFGLQRALPNAFGGRGLRSLVLDFVWHSGTLALFVMTNLRFTTTKGFREVKHSWIEQRNRKYLAYLYENNRKFGVPFQLNLEEVEKRAYSDPTKLKNEAEKAYEVEEKEKVLRRRAEKSGKKEQKK